MVKVVIENNNSRILGYLPEEVQKSLDKTLSYTIKNAHYVTQNKKNTRYKKWDGTFHLYKKNHGQSFFSGLLSMALETLDSHEIEYTKVDKRKKPTQNLPNLVFNPGEKYEERDYQQFSIDRSVKRTRGILKVATGGGKCLGKGTPVMMFDGTEKPVEDVVAGDVLMGPDSTPRNVLSTTCGFGELYRIKQKNGENYICNDAHILCLERTSCPSRGWHLDKQIEITAKDYFNSSKWFKHTHKGYKVGVDFSRQPVPIDPYFLGLWLGDGNSRAPSITTGDYEIENYIRGFASKCKLQVSIKEEVGNCKTYRIVANNYSEPNVRKKLMINFLRVGMSKLNLFKNKHIPKIYKFNDRKTRLSLLAGLIDSDGNAKRKGSVEFCNTNKKLAEEVCWLARSLGYRASCNLKKCSIKSTGYSGVAYRVILSGKISNIPLLLKRKCQGDQTKYKALRYGIDVNPIGKGDYYGFEIDGDRKFLLGDFTVTHNTMMVAELIGRLKTAPFMFYVLTQDLMDQAYDTLSSTLNIPIGKIGAGEFDVQDVNVCTIQTAIRCLNVNNPKFKISDYQFDEDDKWDKKQIESDDKLQHLKRLLAATRGIYFDETHHAAAKTCQEVLLASPEAFWRYGGSATPYREDGAEIMIQAIFGKKIVDVNASYLIKRGFLLEPYIVFEPIEHETAYKSYKAIYKHCIVDNIEFNNHVAEQANLLVKNDMSTLVLVREFPQGDYLKTQIPGAEFVTSRMTRKRRREAIQRLRTRETMCMIATSLADEGLDIPTLNAALLAGGGASETRFHQRVGRTLRIDRDSPNERDRSLVVYYHHKVKHLDKHAKKAKKIAKTEECFNLIESAGQHAILNEISEIMGFHEQTRSIFDI